MEAIVLTQRAGVGARVLGVLWSKLGMLGWWLTKVLSDVGVYVSAYVIVSLLDVWLCC